MDSENEFWDNVDADPEDIATIREEPSDQETSWRQFTAQHRRPRGDPDGWRAWIGSDVVCRECGCCLNTLVYKCPDCGKTGTWKRSRVHAVGHRLTFLFWVPASAVVYSIAIPFALALLAIPVILLLDIVGVLDSGPPWEWGIDAQVLVGLGIAIEVAVILNWKRLSRAWQRMRRRIETSWQMLWSRSRE